MFIQNSISFDSEDVSFELEKPNVVQDWIQQTIIKEGKLVGEISYIFCSDEYLHKINLEHLQHDTLTDIITFNYCEEGLINSDIFISVDRVRDNAELFKTSFENELSRVMIHGILHLVGYDDKRDEDKVLMRSKEDFYLTLR
jgi:rRNA maturation RNase YbeY|tara:strand:- start:183 stop:608 length:426 start_codon:yes stop_codon:yes gene_type:complete